MNNTYDMRQVEILNLTGTVHITVFAKGYYTSFLDKSHAYYGSDTLESMTLHKEIRD